MNFENLNIWCWIIPALVGIISGVLGYLIGKSKDVSVIDTSSDTNKLETENAKLKADLAACNKKLSNAGGQKEAAIPAASLDTNAPVAMIFDMTAAKAAMGKRIKQDDLKIVEGIGPKIEGLFHNFGIKTWKALSEASTIKCQEVLNSGGSRYRIHDPASWPMQAKMAYEGQWKDLSKWQIKHKAGKF
ncbi:hypothetical protein DKG77_04295 [Flagellimonas aquimarina]|uniref:LSU ribosomal protein L21p n=1 Tax=Flagellimonas aquimarina TaxID=2201895 RepID=A0A316L6X7_9FLAO|nr:hypothetical protein [Allomuricauda koreensis]PWL40053.1 hypothetical protein DKG77_04295 [Allomuricauda koreensis]